MRFNSRYKSKTWQVFQDLGEVGRNLAQGLQNTARSKDLERPRPSTLQETALIYAAPGTTGAKVQYKARYDNFIGGQWKAPVKGQYFDVVTPISGQVYTQAARSDAQDIELALDAAHAAAGGWGKTSPTERSNILLKIADRIEANLELLAYAETVDNGKPIRESRDIDIPLVIRHFYHHAGWAQIADQEFSGYVPVGVCAQIIPWNFPLLMLAWKIAPALAAGNTVVLKPAEWTSLTALLFAEICHEVGLPAGVVNIITGDGVVGAALADHPDVHKVAFTGSTMVAVSYTHLTLPTIYSV